ncbi:hypothetical protein RGF97_10395 [Streptomyces roseicoloratus]|uniref:Integral membrane protein n=1 Tax=Streptomyces roseicoloratus TaxID=2508722 RepID=A0ABY9RTA4_9ACTN|nr:hypothetical protein [Streptomyces roseicoloratus]WMX45182.1 hypothetical protein RGF97_10395 [Streptomyces roseicoloratus]
MRGPAAPTSPGPWDSRSEALLGAPALATRAAPARPLPPGALDLSSAPVAAPEPVTAPVTVSVAPVLPVAEPVTAPAAEAGVPAVLRRAGRPGRSARHRPRRRVSRGDRGAGVPPSSAVPAAHAEAIQQPPARPARRGPADPVKALMHRHRELCERAVDPLEIAAGLEAHGVTDRTAARFRHRDVFSLAEELYARVPRGDGTPAPTTAAPAAGTGRARRGAWALAACAPGAVAALATAALTVSTGGLRVAAALLGALGLAAALALVLRGGPLRATGGTVSATALGALRTLWLLGYAAAGDGLLDQLLSGGPDAGPAVVTVLGGPVTGGGWAFDTGPLLALALSAAPAAWCARLFAVRARRRLDASRGLADFAAGARPLLFGSVVLHHAALAGLLALTGFHPGALALGTLLLLARMLAAHGFPEAAAAALTAVCAAEVLALASVLAARLPGFDVLAVPVRALVAFGGPAALPALVCGLAALVLLAHATDALSRASAHA